MLPVCIAFSCGASSVPRRSVVLVLGALTLAGAGAGGFALLHRDHAVAYGSDSAVRDFRSRSSEAPSPASSAASAGVYRYATSGSEHVDALGGVTHDYPTVTTVTYQPSGCGTEDRWQPLTSRFNANVTCRTTAGLELRQVSQQREFFGRTQGQSFTCPAGLVELPALPAAGLRSSAVCRTSDGSVMVALSVTVVDTEGLAVGGKQVDAVVVDLAGKLSGQSSGTLSRRLWLQAGTGLLLRAEGTTSSKADSLAGTVSYTERYRLDLKSVDPSR